MAAADASKYLPPSVPRTVNPVTTPCHLARVLLRVAALLPALLVALLATACGDTPRGSTDPATPPFAPRSLRPGAD